MLTEVSGLELADSGKGKIPLLLEGQRERRSKIEISLHCATEKNENGREPVLKFENYSSWERLRRLTAWIQRFCRNARKVKDHDSGELSAEELEGAEIYWMKYIQEENYPEDIKALKTNKSIPKDSKIFKLSPFLSKNCLLLVKGRLQNVNLSSTLKHPIVLPSNHLLVKMIIYDAHEKVFHSGVSETLTQIREKYWIIKGRQSIKSTL
ncbi:uncharacterized protein NPIL_191231, partial [Nephila pilipes]